VKVVLAGSLISSQPGLTPSSGFGTKFRNGKMRLLVKIERRAGSVTIASGKARLKRIPSAASESMCGVWIFGEPYAPTWSGRRLSMISRRTFVGSSASAVGTSQPAFARTAAPAAPAAPAWRNLRLLRGISAAGG
jgi:hypothetical protein